MDYLNHHADHPRFLQAAEEDSRSANVGMVVGILLFIVSVMFLICFCCCFQDLYKKKKKDRIDEMIKHNKEALVLVETDSSGSEAEEDAPVIVAPIDSFLKGRQAAMAEGLRDEPMDAYAVGYMDGVSAAQEHKSMLSDDQVKKLAKKLGYAGTSADSYVQGFQYGFRHTNSSKNQDSTAAFETGLVNAQARGLMGKDQNAYAKGYVEGHACATTPAKIMDDAALAALAQDKYGYSGSRADFFVAGYHDGVHRVVTTDNVLDPTAAFQKGLSNAGALGLSGDAALAHATGYQHGYATALTGDGRGPDDYGAEELLRRAAESGYTEEEMVQHYCAGFEEGLDEGNQARTTVLKKGFARAAGLGLTGLAATAFATGYKDGIVQDDDDDNNGNGTNPESELKQRATDLFGGNDDDMEAFYIRGFSEGKMTQTMGQKDTVLLPSEIFEKGFLEAQARNGNHGEASAAHATGRKEGYCYGLAGGEVKPDYDILNMAVDRGFDDDTHAQAFVIGFQTGVVEGNAARDVALQKGRGKAIGLGLKGDEATAYTFGYRDGYSETISGQEPTTETALRKRAKKLGLGKQEIPLYVKGFQDGHRDALEALAAGSALSQNAAYATGLINAKSLDMKPSVRHAYATGYSEGYEAGLNGDEVLEDDLLASANEHNFNSKEKTRKAFRNGFADGYDDGLDTRQKQASRILSPSAAWSRGYAMAVKEEDLVETVDPDSFATGFADGYCIGINGHQCPTDDQLMIKARELGVDEESYLIGFQRGYREGKAGTSNRNVLSLNEDGALQKGIVKAENHGMKGAVAKAYCKGYQEGYKLEVEGGQTSDATQEELEAMAKNAGFVEYKLVHAFIAGYLAGQGDGGAAVLHHSLCDVHRCGSMTCRTCLNMQQPTFLQIPNGYGIDKNQEILAENKSWWKKKVSDTADL